MAHRGHGARACEAVRPVNVTVSECMVAGMFGMQPFILARLPPPRSR